MTALHWNIVEELVGTFRRDAEVVAVSLFGSLARGGVHTRSDIDIEVVTTSARDWRLQHQERRGIRIDLVTMPPAQFSEIVARYPHLSYDYLSMRVVHDPDEFMARHIARLEAYFADRPEVAAYWEADLAAMRAKKDRGEHRMADIVAAYDEAERRFSEDGRITRPFLRG